jgi:PKD repeat protein
LSKINSYTFNSSLPAGTYYWGIQAIDNVYAGSLFATGAFTITDIQASNLKFTDITTGSMKITWDRGNEQKCAVFMKQGSAGLPAITNYTNYIADTVFGNGTLAGDGWYCIYNGNGQNVSVTGLRASNVYKIMVIEYSGETGQEIYLSFSNSTNPQTCYTQEQFIKQTGIGITISPSTSSVVCGDYDNDGDLDILLTGYSSSRISKIYCNNGDNTFTDQSGIALTGVTDGSMAWGDYDNDGDLDILLTGLEGSTFISKIYNNNGGNSFTEQTGIVLPGVWQSSVAWGDYDNDGDLDFILTGQTGSIYSDCISKIYRNNGDGSFTEQSEITLTNVTGSSVAWGDHDNDGDFDILLIGYTGYEYISRIYRNNGYNSFTEQTDILLTGLGYGSAAWGDYDNDGDLDIILTGYNGSIRHSKIYRNNGDNSFTEQTGISLPGVMNGSASWSDYDNDGDLDILLTGNSDLTYVSKIYQNNGDNSFTEQPGIVIEGVSGNSLAWGDYDNDGDLDILSIGNPNIIYSNNSFKENSAPAVPSDIVAYLSDKELILSWDKATDAETPQLSLSYNLRVGTTPGGCEILSPMSLPDGRHKIVTIGNVEHDTKWTIDLSQHFPLPENIYYSVQAIDNGFMASAWSSEKSEISDFVADFLPYTVCQKTEVQFQDKSYSIQYPVISYLWKFTEGTSVTTSSLQNPIYTFQTSGTKQVELTITNSTGVSTVRTKSITVLPAPLADFSALPVCQGTLTNIVNTTQINTTKITGWSWNFGDGTPNSTEKDPGTHSYNIGTFNLSLTVHADNGCMLTTTKEVFIAELPSKLLSISGNTNFCANENTSLSADYKDYYTYQWMANGALIPDSTRDNLYPKSSATYSAAITNTLANNCTIQSDPVVLTVKSSPPVLIITGPQGKVFCLNDTASRLSAPLISGLTYNWMVNGNLAFSGSNTFVPQQSGTYTLSVSNADNCSQLSSNSIPDILINQVPAVPNVTSPTPIFCSGTSFSMETPYSNELAYQWLDNGAVVSGAVQNKYSPAISGKYSVRITKNGCSNTSLSTDVTILPTPFSPAIVANNPTTFCQGDSVILSATNNTGYTYQWKRDGGAVGTNSSQFVAKSSGNYNLVVSNANGCSVSSTNSVDIIVNPVPSAGNISLSGPPTFCEGGSITLSVPSATGYIYNWRNEYGLISGANTNSYAAGTSGTYQLDISNPSGCTVKTSTVNITVKTSPYKPVLESVNYEAGTCPGENTIRLSSTQTVAEYQYQWYKDGLPLLNKTLSNLDLTELGNYKLEVSLGGCMVESDVFNINFPGAPEKPFIYAQGPTVWYLACSNTKASKYIWYCNDKLIEGADKYYYVANRKMGDYQVSIANELGCYTRSDVVTIPTGATGINDIDPFEGLIIYPNPTTGMFTIEMDNDLFGELLITIITEQGKEIRTIKSEKTTEYFFTQIDLSGQSKGLYFINLAIDKYFATRKIVIE